MVRLTSRLILVLLFVACGRRETRVNEGVVCVLSQVQEHSWREPQAFAPDAAVYVAYFVDGCLSSSCDVEREASCTATLNGDVLQIDSSAAWTSRTGPGACTDDCGRLSVICATPPLPAGTYVVRHGNDEVGLTVPSQPEQAPCTGQPSG